MLSMSTSRAPKFEIVPNPNSTPPKFKTVPNTNSFVDVSTRKIEAENDEQQQAVLPHHISLWE